MDFSTTAFAALLGPALVVVAQKSKQERALDGFSLVFLLGFGVLSTLGQEALTTGLRVLLFLSGAFAAFGVQRIARRAITGASHRSLLWFVLPLVFAVTLLSQGPLVPALSFAGALVIALGSLGSTERFPLVAAAAAPMFGLLTRGTLSSDILDSSFGPEYIAGLVSFYAGALVYGGLMRRLPEVVTCGHAHHHHNHTHGDTHQGAGDHGHDCGHAEHGHGHDGHDAHDCGHAEHGHGHDGHDAHKCGHAEHGHGHDGHDGGHKHADHAHDHAGHGHVDHGHTHASPSSKPAALGALLAASVLFLLPFIGVSAFVDAFIELFVDSAPALLLGYALAGLVPALLTKSRTMALSKGGRIGQSVRGVLFGLPLPICSCGVLPVYESLVRRGAPAAAALAFFVATPELGLDAVLLSLPLLGSSLTIARVVAAFAVALLVALLVRPRESNVQSEVDTSDESSEQDKRTTTQKIKAAFDFGFVDVFDHTMPWVALGLLIAALAEPLLSHEIIAGVPEVLQVPIAALIGVPVYVCASGATPIAALAIHKGLSSGAAIAFLIAGPATNVTTFGVLSRLHSRRVAIQFGLAVTILAALCGFIINAIGVSPTPLLEGHDHAGHTGTFSTSCAIVLSLLFLWSLMRQGPRGILRNIVEPIHNH